MEKTLDTPPVMYVPTTWEIVHAMVLPPDSPASAEASDYGGKVLFINNRYTPPSGGWETNDQPTFVWNPSAASAVEEHVMVGNQTYWDLFCSGSAFLGNGNLMTSGGLNRPAGGGAQEAVGHGQSYILRTDLMGLPLGDLVWEIFPDVSYDRYYPTAVTLDDGNLLTTGHTGLPLGGNLNRQTSTVSMGTWGTSLDNHPFGDCDNPGSDVDVRDYPRLHVLRSGELMYMDSETRSPPDPVPFHVSYFIKLTGDGECENDPDDIYRWREGIPNDATIMGQYIPAQQAGGTSLHLITRADGNQAFVSEVVYAIGGVEHGVDDQPCPCDQDGVFASNHVFRMVDPSYLAAWEIADAAGTAPKDMTYSRVNANSVVLLDGSILVVGGAERDAAGGECDCLYRKKPELYKPPEVFEGITLTSWKDMAPQIGKRQYHSVAGLLPDGRVFSAGGTAPGDQKTVELYRPPYFFRGPRPSIVSTFPTARTYYTDMSDFITVSLRGGGENAFVKRVAILRNAAVTHADDMNQRYVELRIESISPIAGTSDVSVEIRWPADEFEAPPGWYLLTVVANMDNDAVLPNSNNLPSRAKWIMLQ